MLDDRSCVDYRVVAKVGAGVHNAARQHNHAAADASRGRNRGVGVNHGCPRYPKPIQPLHDLPTPRAVADTAHTQDEAEVWVLLEQPPNHVVAADPANAKTFSRPLAEFRIYEPAHFPQIRSRQRRLDHDPRVLSPAGKALLPARKAELEEFLKQLKHETENLKTL